MYACNKAMVSYLSNENIGINTNNVTVSLGRVSLSSNQQTAPRIALFDQSHLKYYGGLVKPYCAKKKKLRS
jgi:hypothetical protein